MITDIILIAVSAVVVFIIGLPIVNWFHKAKKGMVNKNDRTNQP